MKKMIFPKAKYLWTMLFCLLTLGANAQTWEQVSIEELTATDVFVIVDITSGRAMSNDGGTTSAPRAVSITLSADNMQLTGDVPNNLKWNITGNAVDGYSFHPNGATTWLYSTSSNNGLRVGTTTSSSTTTNLFTMNSGYIYAMGLNRYVGMYNHNSDWRSYTSIHNNIINTQTRFFKFVEVEAAVATPTFSVASGTYYYPQQVFISCADENAVIYYTVDGTTPDENANVYDAPITVSESMTIKAIAVVGTEASNVGTAVYTLPVNVEDIAALRTATADNTTLYRLNSDAVVTYTGASRNQKFIQDATAGILIDDAAGTITSSYVQGDVMSGLVGQLTTYSQMLEFVPVADPGAPTIHDSIIAPAVVTIDAIDTDYEAQLVQVRNVTFASTGEFAASTDYALNESERVNVRLRYAESDLVGTQIPTTAQDITAVVYRFNNTFNLVPRNVNDLAEASEALECTEAPTMNACTTELNAVHNTVITSSVASVGNEGCSIRHYGFIAGAGPDILLNNDSESIEIGTSIDAGEDFSFEIDYRGSETIYVRSYAINDIDTAYSDVTTFRPAEPAIYTVTFNIGGNEEEIEPIIFNEGDRPIELPYGYDCKDIQFVGWALDSITGTTTNKPTLYQEFTPTSDTTFYAIFCNSRSQSHPFDYFNITRSSFAETVTAYGTEDEWTAITGNWNDTIHGYCDLFNASGDFMQMNASRGGMRNTTPLPGGISYLYIEANAEMTPRDFTPYFSDIPLTKDNYLTAGTPGETYTIGPGTYDYWYWSPTEGHPYFYLAFTGGAAFINFIGIDYHADLLEYQSTTTDTIILYEKFCTDNGYEAYSDFGFYIENPTSGTYYNTLEQGLCTTFYELHLTVEETDTTHRYLTSCQPLTLDIPGLYEPYTFYESGDYSYIDYSEYEGSYACENWITYHVTISNETHNEEINICRSSLPYTYNDTVFEIGSESGEYTFTYPTDLGCENTVILTLNIQDGYNTVDEVTICGEEYSWEGFGDMQTLTTSGTYYDYRENEWGCTDTLTLVLTLNHEDIDTINAQICEGGVYDLNGFLETEPGEYWNYYTNAGGCDSIVVLLLSQGESFINELNAEICSNGRYVENGFEISGLEAGEYEFFDTIAREGTCDSIVKLYLTVHDVAETVDEVTVCANILDTFTWNGYTHEELTAMTAPVVILSAQNGCDSIVTLSLTILESASSELTEETCGSYTWNNEILTQSGEYTQTFTAANGCDSVVTLHLTILTTDYADFAEHACGSYTWNNEVYTESGDYTQTFTTENGC
ncbi:MAG: chitobiase/beta-hexosaminidase C-terminal domain-containing protein, partial [Bacteroidales bacterium]|nr:chitobiase/beta-hexosaminidase C-terminal domain-containing protein [Bacteroidales bacterium]